MRRWGCSRAATDSDDLRIPGRTALTHDEETTMTDTKKIEMLRTEIEAAEHRVLKAPIETRATEQKYLDTLRAELARKETTMNKHTLEIINDVIDGIVEGAAKAERQTGLSNAPVYGGETFPEGGFRAGWVPRKLGWMSDYGHAAWDGALEVLKAIGVDVDAPVREADVVPVLEFPAVLAL
jgi:hypothetical protein